ncbi:MAG: hypothetical protein OXG97_12565 [Candidatus Poribacteria bacterium]|nr:hypothetical protein [Candidatus Poribacteria bacterium]
MLSHRIAGIALFVLLVVLFIGCDRVFYKTVDIRIQAVDIVSISEERPAEVRFVVGGIKADGCDPSIQMVSAERMGNTIVLEATGSEEKFDSGGYYCTLEVEATGGEIVVKDLEVGEYKVATHDGRELLGLRIEKGAATVVRKAAIGDITVEIKTSEGFVLDRIEYPPRATFVVRKMGPVSYPFVVREAGLEGIAVDYPVVYTAEPVQVSMRVEAHLTRYVSGYCEKIVIDRESRGLMNIEIFGEVPINADYYQYSQRFDDVPAELYADVLARQLLFGVLRKGSFEAETDLGSFEAGDYRVNINGSDEVGFSIQRRIFTR